MKSIDRGNYVSTCPYLDQPQSIGYGVTISAPHMVWFHCVNVYIFEYLMNSKIYHSIVYQLVI